MIKVYGYARKSPDDEQRTEVSIENQVSLIKKTCSDKGWKLVKVFIDKNLSGGDRLRKEFVAMISDSIENKSVDIIVVKDQDRFARDSSFFADTLKDLDLRNIQVYSVMKKGFISYEDLGDRVKALIDEHYIITQRKKSDILFTQKMENNLPSTKAPFGYRYSKSKNWIIDRGKAKIVREVYADFKGGVNYKITLKRLKIKKGLYYGIIQNIEKGVYVGWIIYNRKFKDSMKNVIRVEEVKYKGTHEPILIV